jgi:hypothetical protein
MEAFRNTSTFLVPCFALVVCGFTLCHPSNELLGQTSSEESASIFQRPFQQAAVLELQRQMVLLSRMGNRDGAEKAAAAATQRMPDNPVTYYNLACMLAINGKTEDAFVSLNEAIQRGFRNPKVIEGDKDLASLRDDDRFQQALQAAAVPFEQEARKIKPAAVKNGVGMVTSANTEWVARRNALIAHFEVDREKLQKLPIVNRHGTTGALLRKWYAEGTAAGLVGDYYDNHDHDHSNLGYKDFPQLSRIEYGPEPRKHNISNGLQRFMFFNGATIGNSSTANVQAPFWRSMSRLFMVDERAAMQAYNQYFGNHMYFYPEHRDYDPGSYGDTYPANTPFVITSQGSSYSDKPFMDAVVCTMAAFRPEVKTILLSRGTLMPTVQMIFRYSNKQAQSDEKYTSGAAHPVVFDSKQIDVEHMVTMAHDIQPNDIPPIVQMKIVAEDRGVLGRDFFHSNATEALFTTPVAIARIYRTLKAKKTMVVDASGSRDPNQQDLKWTWSILQGNRNKVKVRPLNAEGSIAEITIYYHLRERIAGSKMESNRIDIGVFVHNGKYFSAPGFVTSYSIDSEYRKYNDQGLIEFVDYNHPTIGKKYTDPVITSRKDWRDEYLYDDDGKLTGWTRHRTGSDPQEFAWNGILVTKRDPLKRPIAGNVASYSAEVINKYPSLTQSATDHAVTFEYESDADLFGKIVEPETR